MSSCLCICLNVLQSPHIEFHCSLIPKRVHHFSSPSLLNMWTCYFLRQKPWHPLHRKVTTRVSEVLPWKQHHSSHFSSCQERAEGCDQGTGISCDCPYSHSDPHPELEPRRSDCATSVLHLSLCSCHLWLFSSNSVFVPEEPGWETGLFINGEWVQSSAVTNTLNSRIPPRLHFQIPVHPLISFLPLNHVSSCPTFRAVKKKNLKSASTGDNRKKALKGWD